ncbi:DUF1918 domain-containing protein [Microbacterium sp.]|uniref:DUF1918 domain-containing protein n=1 Tax=Microbacterium sp. TaxID=51671 RepID=UPI003A9357FB
MNPRAGDRIRIHGHDVGAADRGGEIIEVRTHGDVTTLVVRFDDGHEAVLSPGTDCEILPAN